MKDAGLNSRQLQLEDARHTGLHSGEVGFADDRRAKRIVLTNSVLIVDVKRNKVSARLHVELKLLIPLCSVTLQNTNQDARQG